MLWTLIIVYEIVGIVGTTAYMIRETRSQRMPLYLSDVLWGLVLSQFWPLILLSIFLEKSDTIMVWNPSKVDNSRPTRQEGK